MYEFGVPTSVEWIAAATFGTQGSLPFTTISWVRASGSTLSFGDSDAAVHHSVVRAAHAAVCLSNSVMGIVRVVVKAHLANSSHAFS
jgi:hypothetical protein